MFKGKATRKALLQYMKKNTTKDITDWCSKNLPCPEDDRPIVTVTEFTGQPSRMTQREVSMLGVLPFNFDEKDLSEWVLDFLDLRRFTLDPVQKTLAQREVSFTRAKLVRTSFRGSACSRTSFERANAELAVFNSTVLIFCNFDGAVLKKTSLVAANLEHASLREVIATGSNFMHATLDYATLCEGWFCSKEYYEQAKDDRASKSEFALGMWAGASFVNSKMKGADLRGAKLCGVDFSGANLSAVSLQNADLRNANFTGAKLCGANISRANLTGARGLEKADLTFVVVIGGVNCDFDLGAHKDSKKILSSREAVEKWAKELSEVNFSFTDLSDCNLAGSKLVGCVFRGADLRHSNFSGSNLTGADFSGAEMFNADMSGTTLAQAKFAGADMRNMNLSAVDLNQIKDALLEAKTLVGMTCTLGMVPDELKSRGVFDSEEKGSIRVNTQALEAADQRIREERKLKMEAEKKIKAQEYEMASIDKLDAMLQSTQIQRIGPGDFAVLRLRILQAVLKERTLNLSPQTNEEREERWAVFNENFGMAKGAPNLKKLYLHLISDEVRDDWIVALWRRTKDLKAARLGTLENMCIEAMIRHREWSFWASDVARVISGTASDYTSYLAALFKTKQSTTASPSAAMVSELEPLPPPPPDPEEFVPPPPDDPADTGSESPGSGSPTLALRSPREYGSPMQHRGSVGRSNPAIRISGSPITSPLATGPTSSGSGIPLSLSASARSPSGRPAAPVTSGGSGTGSGVGIPLGAAMTPPVMAAPLPPVPGMPPQGMAPMPGLSPSLMSPGAPMAMPQMMPIAGMGSGTMGMVPMQGRGMMTGLPGPPMTLPGPPMTLPGSPMMMTGMPMMMAPAPGMGMMPTGMIRAAPPQPNPSVSRVKCVECGMVMEANFIAYHKRECRMRLVSCSQCKYSMRFIQWDSHNRFCNTAGPCPLCGKQIKDNLVVHLYEKHTTELTEKGFFQGAEPPVKMR